MIIDENNQKISLSMSICLKAIFAVGVVLGHMFNSYGVRNAFETIFTKCVFLFVGMFFFLSGYGMMRKYVSFGNKYSIKNLINRLLKLLLPYIIVNVIYCLLKIFINQREIVSIMHDYFDTFRKGGSYVPYTWYVIAALFMYIIFYISACISKGQQWMVMVYCSLLTIALIVVLILIKYPEHWIYSLFGFCAGMYYYIIPDENNKSKVAILKNSLIQCALFAFTLVIANIIPILSELIITDTVIQNVRVCAFCFLIAEMLKMIKIDNKILLFLGTSSYEIYLYQSFYIGKINAHTHMVNMGLTLLLVVLTGVVMHNISKRLNLVFEIQNIM